MKGMSWYERVKCYAEGGAAMAYCYTQILPMIYNDHASTIFLVVPKILGQKLPNIPFKFASSIPRSFSIELLPSLLPIGLPSRGVPNTHATMHICTRNHV